jgi:hypothetical protein
MLDFAEEAEPLFKEELVLKIAILAEKFADNLQVIKKNYINSGILMWS